MKEGLVYMKLLFFFPVTMYAEIHISIIAISLIEVCTLVTYKVSAMGEYTNKTECIG